MSGTTTIQVGAVEGVIATTGARRGRRLRRRHLWLIPGLAVAIYANTLGQANGVGILALIAFGIAPDVPRLFGTLGRPAHDALHQPLVAVGVLAVAAVAVATTNVLPIFWLVGALVWVGHIMVGWGVGDVPHARPDLSNA
jgi:hypothetical protein